MMIVPSPETTAENPVLSEVPGAPRAFPGLIPRRRFLEWMTTNNQAPARMICGGAGYGKTSALLSWLFERDQGDTTTIWITLDANLKDRGAFWLLVLHQISRAGIEVDPELERALRESEILTSLFPTLLIKQFEISGPMLLIIDNADLGADTEVATDLTRILDHVASLRLVLTTRSAPGTSRLEHRLGSLVVVSPPHLVLLDPGEITEMASRNGRILHPTDAQRLHDVTDGWPLAVRAELTALGSDAHAATAAPGTATRALGARLLERFRTSGGFSQLRRRTLAPTFSSVHLDGPLRDLLDELVEIGLGWWEDAPYRQFRLQPVLRGLLREEYELAEPQSAKAEYLMLAEMHDARDEYAAAFDAAVRAEAWPTAIRVYRRHLLTLTSRPPTAVLSVRRVPAGAQRTYPQLAFAVALDDFANGRRARAVRGLAQMLQRIEREHLTGRRVSVEDVWTQAIITMSHRLLGRHEMAGSSLRRVHRMLERVDDPHSELDPAMSLFLSHGALVSLLGDDPEYAARFLSEGGVIAPPQTSAIEQSRLYGIRALVAMLRGEVHHARKLLDIRADLPLAASTDATYTGLPAMIASARLWLEEADAVRAKQTLENTHTHAPTTDLWPLLITAAIQVHWHLHGAESALMQLDEELATREGRFSDDSVALVPLTALRMHLLLSQGRTETARQVLSASPRHGSRRFQLVRTRLELAEGNFQRAAGRATIGLRSAPGPRERQTFALFGASAALHLGESARAERLVALVVRMADEHGVRLPLTSVPRADIDQLLRGYPDLLSQLEGFSTFPPSADAAVRLTPRETVVLRTIVDHGTVAAVSAELSVSENTVKSQLRSLYRKLGAGNREAAVDAARHRGLL
ncbi:LuxR C-terminal-related transcriptional regulator [Microbacterium sp.]|uniref:LuxR C-terminal-related transcriptional regulator n=1 Tax=Microbacterium sp. TaxID=51671 RepID=UPI0027365F6C|nr:LuxR C-terminal-related transcriptional regulator [Microbacterium sp.]MDP3949172.1 LuxR C-terminal-related transcriptional regulator [Microbacterium sp.]